MGRARRLQGDALGQEPAPTPGAGSTPSEVGYLRSVEAMNRNLVALSRVAKPHISVVDGFVAMHREGPRHGTPIRLGTVVAGVDAVAVDAVAAAVMGFDPLRIGYLRYAQDAGLGRGEPRRDRDRRRPARLGRPPVRARTRTTRSSATGTACPRSAPVLERRVGHPRPARPGARTEGPTMNRPTPRPVAVVVALTDPSTARLARASPGSPTRPDRSARSCSSTPRDSAVGGGLATRQRPGDPPTRRPARPELWRDGLLATDADLVAFSTAQMIPRRGWLAALVDRLRSTTGAAGVGGPIEPGRASRATDRAVALLRYSGYFPPLTRSPRRSTRRATTPSIVATALMAVESAGAMGSGRSTSTGPCAIGARPWRWPSRRSSPSRGASASAR